MQIAKQEARATVCCLLADDWRLGLKGGKSGRLSFGGRLGSLLDTPRESETDHLVALGDELCRTDQDRPKRPE